MFMVKFIFCPSKADLWRLQSTSLNRNEPKQRINTWQITEVSNSTRWHANNSGHHDVNSSTLVKILPIPPNEVPFMNTSEAIEKAGRVTEQITAKRQRTRIFGESFMWQVSCRPATTFELAVIQWIYQLQKSTVGNAITCNENKTSFPIRKQIYGFLLLFVELLLFKRVTNLFYGCVKCFPSSCGFRHSVCFSI